MEGCKLVSSSMTVFCLVQWIHKLSSDNCFVSRRWRYSLAREAKIPFTKPVQWYLLMSLQFVLCLNDIVNKMENTSLPCLEQKMANRSYLVWNNSTRVLKMIRKEEITLVINHSTQWSRYVSVYQ